MSTHRKRRRFIVSTEIVLLVVTGIVFNPLIAPSPAMATADQPVVIETVSAPTGVTIDSAWVTDSTGLTAWAFGINSAGTGVLVRRDLASHAMTTTAALAGEGGTTDARIMIPNGNIAFLAKRAGQGGRLVVYNPTTKARVGSYTLAATDTIPRGIGWNATGTYAYIGSNPGTSQLTRVNVSTGALISNTVMTGTTGPITSGLMYNSNFWVTTATNPVNLVNFSGTTTITQGVVTPLTGISSQLVGPVLTGSTAWFGTDGTPGRLVGVDLVSRTVVGDFPLEADETGLRNIVIATGATSAWATTTVGSHTRLLKLSLSDGTRLASTDIGAFTGATSVTLTGRYIDVTSPGPTALVRMTTATAPTAPTNISVAEADGALSFAWAPSISEEPGVVYTATIMSGGFSQSCTTVSTLCNFTGLTNGVTYLLSIVASSSAGSSATTTTSASPANLPEAPTDVRVTRGSHSISVEWTPGFDGGRKVTAFTATADPGGHSCSSDSTLCSIDELLNGVEYTVTVKARTSWGESPLSQPSAAVVPATFPQPPPRGIVVNSDGSAMISWIPSEDDGGDPIMAYRVSVWSETAILRQIETTEHTVTFTSLENGKTYPVSIEAMNSVGHSNSLMLRANPEAPPAPAPPSPRATITAPVPVTPHVAPASQRTKPTVVVSVPRRQLHSISLSRMRRTSSLVLTRFAPTDQTYLRVRTFWLRGSRFYVIRRVAAVRASDFFAASGLATRSML